jgi:hypothetical protein
VYHAIENRIGLAAVAIGERAGADAADHPEQQRDCAEQSGQRLVHREALLDVGEDEGEDREVERVEHPGGEGGEEGLPLSGGHLAVPRRRHVSAILSAAPRVMPQGLE